MATSFKTLLASDTVSDRTNLHEAIPITGTIVSGTYAGNNIKNYAHGMFQSIYDYPYLSSSANHIFDITLGLGFGSSLAASTVTQMVQKQQMYNEMAQVLVGYDATGSIRAFDPDGNFTTTGDENRQAYFINFSRLLTKDEIKKSTFEMIVGVDPTGTIGVKPFTKRVKIYDASGSTQFRSNSPAGEYGILYASGNHLAGGQTPVVEGPACGLIYYQAGIAVITSSIFQVQASGGLLQNTVVNSYKPGSTSPQKYQLTMISASSYDVDHMIASASISGAADALTRRIQNITFNNTTELNSTIYFCRANSNEFNYSSNPTYLSASKIRVKNVRSDQPISYITTVGLYGANNELLAVAKLSEPLKKTPSNEFTLRVRLDY